MSNSSSTSGGGAGVVGLLTVALVILKLCHVITWSWWWILSPVWISALGVVVALLAILLVAVIGSVRS